MLFRSNKYTSGWKEFNAYVMGKTDGIEKTPAWASKVTGVPESRIKSLAHELQENRTMIMMKRRQSAVLSWKRKKQRNQTLLRTIPFEQCRAKGSFQKVRRCRSGKTSRKPTDAISRKSAEMIHALVAAVRNIRTAAGDPS